MNKKIASVLVGIFVMGLVSAGLVSYLSNMVSGSVVVEGPVFYANSGYNLLINNFLSGYTYTLNNAEDKIFLSVYLDEPLDFYKPELTLYVKANLSEGIEPKNLDLEFLYIDTDNNLNHICNSPISVSVYKGDWQELSGSCIGTGELKNVDRFRYVISGMGDDDTVYKIKIDGYTRVEMDKAI